jgi:hypothetical protein
MQEETNSILHQRRQNGCSNKSMFILKLLPKHTKQITKCHAFHEYVVVENVENLDVGCFVCDVPPVSSRGLVVSLYDT